MKEFQKSNELVEFWQWSANDKTDGLAHRVMQIIEDVRERKDSALIDYTKKFDGVDIRKFRVEHSAIEKAKNQLDRDFAEIVKNAAENIRRFHSRQIPESWLEKSKNGVTLGQKFTPIESAGIYVPGGRAAYPSTLIMNCVPAQLAGVPRIAVVSPPCQNGEMNPLILGCAGLMEIDEVYCIGGAQAIAALAYGTESVKPVAMITGPGNKYVNEAKRQVFGKVGIDMPAGPTELVIFTDGSVSMEYIIWDLIAQAEHDPDAKTALISTSRNFCKDVLSNIEKFAKSSPRIKIIEKSMGENSAVITVKSINEGIDLINKLAPEHLEILTENPENISKKIKNAGTMFLGGYTPAAVGDYWAGPNHTLPTSGAARFASPLNVMDFMKFSSIVKFGKDALKDAMHSIITFAEYEELFAHAKSIKVRNV